MTILEWLELVTGLKRTRGTAAVATWLLHCERCGGKTAQSAAEEAGAQRIQV